MARGLRGLPRRALWLLLVQSILLVSACQDTHYSTLVQERCLTRFQKDMEAVGEALWCDWGKTIRSYGELTDCTRNVAEKLGCFWPNTEVDRFFVTVHRHYFSICALSGRAVQDPSSGILCPFIVVPIMVTLLVTALVVWRSKRTEGIV
ncbi:Receptor activity-modifying protein 1 [Sciurus carolinensis]|uniref:Receptor activity-modifying protein 1 n=1 Tax=Sciurus carolinensis TaxID=30640 RepID=A0AA41N5M9_SCICA|nr:receptor activity-modifying protein 1 [Sciurus carolinensis]MBZ3884255.1 Receptor activity-modifying protein 1 [Sciurus carolinensis]